MKNSLTIKQHLNCKAIFVYIISRVFLLVFPGKYKFIKIVFVNLYLRNELFEVYLLKIGVEVNKGSLAQLGEHYLDKVGVAGSSPVGTIKKREKNLQRIFLSFYFSLRCKFSSIHQIILLLKPYLLYVTN